MSILAKSGNNNNRIDLGWSISLETFNILKEIQTKHNGKIEFRDTMYTNYEELQKYRPDFTLEDWRRRNPYDTDEISELFEYDLIEDCEDAWRSTYKISEKGLALLEKYK